MERAFEYRFSSSEARERELLRTVGWYERQRRVNHAEVSALLTERKRTDDGCRDFRDVNAATNILAAGRAVTACGAGARPSR